MKEGNLDLMKLTKKNENLDIEIILFKNSFIKKVNKLYILKL